MGSKAVVVVEGGVVTAVFGDGEFDVLVIDRDVNGRADVDSILEHPGNTELICADIDPETVEQAFSEAGLLESE
jgi:hypothetical protein